MFKMGKLLSWHNFALCFTTVAFALVSKIVFDSVFATSTVIIDEEFHLPQGLLYCNFTFNTWNPKITTLPGLYLVTAFFLGSFNLCTVYWLRFINLIGSVINLLLLNIYFNVQDPKVPWLNLISSINLAILPPLYFFSHIYYTDVLSISFVLLCSICSKTKKHMYASVFGTMAVIMRQTNIIWVGFLFGQYVLTELLFSKKHAKRKDATKDIPWRDATTMIKKLKLSDIWNKLTVSFWINTGPYLALFLSFLFFIYFNGGIVVGDKTAHVASLHLPQLFYFVLFCSLFGWPFFVTQIKRFVSQLGKTKVLTFFALALVATAVYYNTVEHPYLLADNRHYTFYIWNRFYKKYNWFRYIMVPIYYFGLFAMSVNLNFANNAIFTVMYLTCTIIVLVLQRMIEIRYFLLPFLFFRLHIKTVKLWQVMLEFITLFLVNIVTFHIFYTKDIHWSDFDYVQKLIW